MGESRKAKLSFKLFLLCFFLVGRSYCQKLFLVAGQSNAAGIGNSLLSPKCKIGTAFEFKTFSDDLTPLADPVGENGNGFDAAQSGSSWPAFAKRYHELSNQQIYIVPAAKSSSTLNPNYFDYLRWDSLGTLLETAVLKTRGAIKKTNIPLSGIIWSQGESDASFINAKSHSEKGYKAELRKLIAGFRHEFGPNVPFYIIQTGIAEGEMQEGYEIVQRVQQEICDELRYTYVVYPFTKYFRQFHLMSDYIHYNQRGYNVIGETIAETIYQIEFSEKYEPPTYQEILFPNPSYSLVNLQLINLALEDHAMIEIFDTVGRQVRQFEIPLSQKIIEIARINVYDLPAAMYTLKLRLQHYQKVYKVLIKYQTQ